MDNRRRLWLLLIFLLTLLPPRAGSAQSIIRTWMDAGVPSSHHDLPGGPNDTDPEAMMAERFRAMQQLHQLQDQVQALLDDPKFANDIKKYDREQLRQLREKILKGEDLGKDKNWQRFLEKAARTQKLEPRQIEMLRRLAERSSANSSRPDAPSLLNEPNRASLPPVLSGPTPSEMPSPPSIEPAEKSFGDRMQDEMEKWLSERLDGMSDDMVRSLAEMSSGDEGAPLAELLRNVKIQSEHSADDFAESAASLSRHLPKLGEFLNDHRGTWSEMRSLFRDTSMPALPTIGNRSASSLPSTASAEGEGWSTAMLTLLTLTVFLLLAWKMGGWARARTAGGASEEWRLGPWPVAPEAVTTRQELVRAFEYVALLCLGRRASTCNHRELAGRLAEQDAANPTRRQAVELLAWLYEQARYAPTDETLSPGELADARHALRYLAGVTAA